MIQFQLNGGLNQQWRLIPQPDGIYNEVMNAYSGLVLDDPEFTTLHVPVIQYTWNGGQNQLWGFSDTRP
jgi:hypothetical protein